MATNKNPTLADAIAILGATTMRPFGEADRAAFGGCNSSNPMIGEYGEWIVILDDAWLSLIDGSDPGEPDVCGPMEHRFLLGAAPQHDEDETQRMAEAYLAAVCVIRDALRALESAAEDHFGVDPEALGTIHVLRVRKMAELLQAAGRIAKAVGQ